MPKITPMLWYDDQAEEAANRYIKVFSGRPGPEDRGESKVLETARYGEAGPGPAGTVMVVSFLLEGQEFTALNGGQQQFAFNESISFVVNCESQEEVDYFWDALADGGEESVCGWLKDRYGVSWQVTPKGMEEMLNSPNQEGAQRAMKAMLGMKKLDLAELQRAFAGE
jgi:predicted 3-demethylubiquinone-9 3-methyltransferase (glyoxalase superfamily)